MTLLFNTYAYLLFWKLADVHWASLPLFKKLMGIGLLLATQLGTVVLILAFSFETYALWYPLFVQAPSILAFYFLSGYGGMRLFFSFLTTVFLSSHMTIATMVINLISTLPFWGNAAILITVFLVSAWLVLKYFVPGFRYIVKHQKSGFWLFSILPLFSLIFFYFTTTAYSFTLLETWVILLIRIALFVGTLVSYIFVYTLGKRSQDLAIAQNKAAILKKQSEFSLQYVEQVLQSQEETKIQRHDMRHHLDLIQAYLYKGDMDALHGYLDKVQSHLSHFAIHEYCENAAANLVFSAFAGRAQEQGVCLEINADIPASLHIEDNDVCVLLSNALETALVANGHGDCASRRILVQCHTRQGKVCIHTENPCFLPVQFADGMPLAQEDGHGHGTRSMAAVVAKYGGLCSFQEQDGIFVFNAVL